MTWQFPSTPTPLGLGLYQAGMAVLCLEFCQRAVASARSSVSSLESIMDGLEDTLGQAPLEGPLPATRQLSLDLNQSQVASERGLGVHFWVLTAT